MSVCWFVHLQSCIHLLAFLSADLISPRGMPRSRSMYKYFCLQIHVSFVLKGTVSWVFLLQYFFHESSSPKPLKITLGSLFVKKFSEIFDSQGAPPVSTSSPREILFWYHRWYCWQICHRCQRKWHKMPLVSTTSAVNLPPVGTTFDSWHLKVNLKKKKFNYMLTLWPKGVQTKKCKLFWLKIFSVCHWWQQHQWCILSCEYLREFSKKQPK